MSNSLDSDQARHVGPDLGPHCLQHCLQRLSAAQKLPLAGKELKCQSFHYEFCEYCKYPKYSDDSMSLLLMAHLPWLTRTNSSVLTCHFMQKHILDDCNSLSLVLIFITSSCSRQGHLTGNSAILVVVILLSTIIFTPSICLFL